VLENGAGHAPFLAQPHNMRESLDDWIGPSTVPGRAEKTIAYRFEQHTQSGRPCDSSCHDCLRDYSNRAYHGLLDWRLALDMADLAAGRPLPDRWSHRAPAIQDIFEKGFDWRPKMFRTVHSSIDEDTKTAYFLVHPLWDTSDAHGGRDFALASDDAKAAGYSVRAISDYLKTGMRAACPAEQEVQDGAGEEGAEAAAADLASAG
jgi:hypothetical protein